MYRITKSLKVPIPRDQMDISRTHKWILEGNQVYKIRGYKRL